MGYGSNTLILLWFAELFALIIVTLVLFALLEVTVTGPQTFPGLFVLMVTGPEPRVWVTIGPLLLFTDTCPRAMLECWMDTDAGMVSEDFPVRGFTDIDWFWRAGGPDIIVGFVDV